MNDILLFIGAAMGEFLLFWLSIQYEVYEGLISWYFPVGLRVLLFLILSWRHVGFAWFGMIIGNACFYVMMLDSSASLMHLIISGLMAVIPLLPIVAVAKYYYNKQTQFGLNTISIMVIFGITYRFVNISRLWLTQEYMYSEDTTLSVFELFFAHQLSGYIGVFVVLQCYFAVYWWIKHRHERQQYQSLMAQLLVFFVLAVVLYYIQPQTAYLMRMFAFIPIIWLAYRYHWIGAIMAIITCNTLILIHVFQSNGTELLLYKPYIISYSLVGFLVGGVMLQHARTMRNISAVGAQLLEQRDQLLRSTEQVKQLSLNMLTVQEHERNWLSEELQSEVKQNLLEFRKGIHNIESQPKMFISTIATMKKNTRKMYDSVYTLMHWLRPRVLDELGLQNVLEGTFFPLKLLTSNIRYSGRVIGDCLLLSDEQTIGVFRIVQDAVMNASQQTHISNLHCELNIQASAICLTLTDDRMVVEQNTSVSTFTDSEVHDIERQSMINRVISLGGSIHIDEQAGLSITITLAP